MVDQTKYRKLADYEIIREGDVYDCGVACEATIGRTPPASRRDWLLGALCIVRLVRLESPGWRYLDEGEEPRYGSDEYQWLGGPEYKVADVGSRRIPGTSNESIARTDGCLRRIMRRRWPEAPAAPTRPGNDRFLIPSCERGNGIQVDEPAKIYGPDLYGEEFEKW